MIDAIARHDPRAGQPTLASWVDREQDTIGCEISYFINLMYPIRDKIVAVVEGNHEYQPERKDGRAVYHEICRRLTYRDGMGFEAERKAAASIALGTEGFIILNFERKTGTQRGQSWPMSIYARHGYGGGRKPGAKTNNLYDMLNSYECDLGLSGHVHEQLYVSTSRISAGQKGQQYRQHVSQGVVCGTYLTSYIATPDDEMPRNTYGQRAAYPPRPHGCPLITIRPDRRHIAVQLSGMPGFIQE